MRKAVFTEYVGAMQKIVGAGRPKEATAAGPAVPAAAAATPAERLKQLDQLRRDGLITEAEAAEKRRQIINSM
jgi:hypothetical protein